MTVRGKICELFFSFQGEGLYLGEPQVFLRLADCNIYPRCIYCDTELRANSEMGVREVVHKIEEVRWPASSISITGGEPLLQVNFLSKLLPLLKKRGFRIYLETNGTLAYALSRIIDDVDTIAMDIKLPSSGHTIPLWERHSQFLKIGRHKELMIKVVVTGDTEKGDFEKAIALVKAIALINAPVLIGKTSVPFILQPVTPHKNVKGIGDRRLWEFYLLARRKLKDVRIIPQVHTIFGIK